MHIDVIMTAGQVKKEHVIGKTGIVLDIFRATSTIVIAFMNGCSDVYPVYSIRRAFNKAAELKEKYVLGGERRSLKVHKFDLGNSPLEYTNEKVSGKSVIITTTNGTKAVERSKTADNLLIGSFLNSEAAAKLALSKGNDIVIVCAGTEGELSLEDVCGAGLIINCFDTREVSLSDAAICAKEIYDSNKDKLIEFLSQTRHYKTLFKNNFLEDIKFCLQKDITDIVPVYKENRIVLGDNT